MKTEKNNLLENSTNTDKKNNYISNSINNTNNIKYKDIFSVNEKNKNSNNLLNFINKEINEFNTYENILRSKIKFNFKYPNQFNSNLKNLNFTRIKSKEALNNINNHFNKTYSETGSNIFTNNDAKVFDKRTSRVVFTPKSKISNIMLKNQYLINNQNSLNKGSKFLITENNYSSKANNSKNNNNANVENKNMLKTSYFGFSNNMLKYYKKTSFANYIDESSYNQIKKKLIDKSKHNSCVRRLSLKSKVFNRASIYSNTPRRDSNLAYTYAINKSNKKTKYMPYCSLIKDSNLYQSNKSNNFNLKIPKNMFNYNKKLNKDNNLSIDNNIYTYKQIKKNLYNFSKDSNTKSNNNLYADYIKHYLTANNNIISKNINNYHIINNNFSDKNNAESSDNKSNLKIKCNIDTNTLKNNIVLDNEKDKKSFVLKTKNIVNSNGDKDVFNILQLVNDLKAIHS